jgi:CubicO group peptidase (beta-lactamase class C family)
MTNHRRVPIDGYINAQEAWLKNRRRPQSHTEKKGAPQPKWDQVFQQNLGNVPGYAYAVAHHGRLVAEGESGYSRTSLDAPQTPWTTTTRINLASVSKCVTTVALLKLLSHRGISIDQPFYPLVQSRCPTLRKIHRPSSYISLPTDPGGAAAWPLRRAYSSRRCW